MRPKIGEARCAIRYSGSTGLSNLMQFQQLSDGASPDFTGLVRIFEASFPASERKSVTALRQMLARPEYMFLIALAGETVTGFSIAIALEGTDATLLEYMAVAAGERRRGLGRELFRRTVSAMCTDGPLLIEVDSDRVSDAGPTDAARRKAFYRGLGCREIQDLTYRMPRVADVDPPPMEMLLCARQTPSAIPKITLRHWLEACYSQVYGESVDDPRIDAMVADLPASVPVR